MTKFTFTWTLFYSARRNTWALAVESGSFQRIVFCSDLAQLMKRHDTDAGLKVEGVR